MAGRALRQGLEREVLARLYRGHEGSGRIRALGLDEDEVLPRLDRVAREEVDLETATAFLFAFRRAFPGERAWRTAVASCRPILAAGLARPAANDTPAALCRLAAGLLVGDEAAIAGSIRPLRGQVARTLDRPTRARLAWSLLVELESMRGAAPGAAARIGAWQQAFLAALADLSEDEFWAPALAPTDELAVALALGRFVLRMQFLLPAGAAPAVLVARHHLVWDLDLAKADRWLAEARRRLAPSGRREPLHDRIEQLEALADGLGAALGGRRPKPRRRSRAPVTI